MGLGVRAVGGLGGEGLGGGATFAAAFSAAASAFFFCASAFLLWAVDFDAP